MQPAEPAAGAPPRARGLIVAVPYVLQAVVALGLVGLVAAAGLDGRDAAMRFYRPALGLALLGAYIVLIVTTWWVAGRFGPPREVLLLRGVPLGRTVGIVLGTTVLVAVASAAVLEPLFHGAKAQDVDPAPWPGGLAATVGVALTVLVFVVLGPVAEELYFRGLVMPALGGLDAGLLRATVGIGGSALVFAVVHWTPAAIPVLALLGAALALVARRTGSIWPGVAIHALNNALATALAFGHAWT